jgi:myosin heavy chain 9/10/11/14
LAATRSDDELRRKEAELALAKERAERDKQERESLQALRMSLEAEKRKVADDLDAERALGIDKDALLERSKKNEAALEDEITALQEEVTKLDDQLSRAMNLQKDTEQKRNELRDMFNQAAEHLVRLEAEQTESAAQEQDLTDQLNEANAEIERLRSQMDELQQVSEELKNLALQREEDLARTKDRTDILVKELEGKLEVEIRNK